MDDKLTIATFLGIFLVTQALGLYIGTQYIQAIAIGVAEPVVENPENIGNSFMLFFYILVGTGMMILMIKYIKFFIRIIEAVAVLTASYITIGFLLPNYFSIFYIIFLDVPIFLVPAMLATILTIWKIFRPSILNQNIAVISTVSGVGALLGASLGILPVLVFMIILSIYDFVSVFITKHMVYMAKALTERPTAFTAAVPHTLKGYKVSKSGMGKKIHVFQLGAGDILIPLLFSVSVLKTFSLTNSIFVIFGSAIALGLLISYVMKRPGKALPALPFVSLGGMAGLLLSFLIG